MIIMDARHIPNLFRAIPFQWTLSPNMNGSGPSSPALPIRHQLHPHHQSPALYLTECRDIVSIVGMEHIVGVHQGPRDLGPRDQTQRDTWVEGSNVNWKRRQRNMATVSSEQTGNMGTAGNSVKHKRRDMTCQTGNKGVKRQLDMGNEASTSQKGPPQSPPMKTMLLHPGNTGAVKRKIPAVAGASGRESPVSGPSMPNKRPLLSVSPATRRSPTPTALLQGNKWDKLSSDIFSKYREIRQSPEIYSRKMRLHEVVCSILRTNFSKFGLYIVGSSMTGFGSNTSDMDMCLMLSHSEIEQRGDALKILRYVLKAIKRREFVNDAQLIPAKVPILKFVDNVSGVEVDLNVNNSVGIRNTHLLICYSRLDWRLNPLVMVIKHWAKAHDINDAKRMTLSSYSLVLMIIHYLQKGVSPPVLPCLHKIYPQKFNSFSDVTQLSLAEELRPFQSGNKQSLGELFFGFLFYYSHTFNFAEDAISVRLGEKVPRRQVQFNMSPKNDPFQWKCICIEEPFDMTNTARAVYDAITFENIKFKFVFTWKLLNEGFDLACVFPPPQQTL